MAAAGGNGNITIGGKTFEDIPIHNVESVESYLERNHTHHAKINLFTMTQEWLRMHGLPPLTRVISDGLHFYAYSEDKSIALVRVPRAKTIKLYKNDTVLWSSQGITREELMKIPLKATSAVVAKPKVARVHTKIEKMTIKELKELFKDKRIKVPSGFTKEQLIEFLRLVEERRELHRKNPTEVFMFGLADEFNYESVLSKQLIEWIEDLLDVEMHSFEDKLQLLIDMGLVKKSDKKRSEFVKTFEEIRKKLLIALEKKYESLVLLKRNMHKTAAFSLDDPIFPKSKVTFRQLKDVIEPAKGIPVKDVYTRWGAITDKQAVIDLMGQIVSDHAHALGKILHKIASNHDRNRVYGLGSDILGHPDQALAILFSSQKKVEDYATFTVGFGWKKEPLSHLFLRDTLQFILTSSVHSHLTSMQYKNNSMIETIVKTANLLNSVGPYTTVKLDADSPILIPAILVKPGEARRPLIWDEYLSLVLSFVLLLPPVIQVNWAESYLQSFIEGYDLSIGTFPVCTYDQLPVFGRSLIAGGSHYTSCHLGMLYHMLISLNTVLFEGHVEPKRLGATAAAAAADVAPVLHKLPPMVIRQLVTGYLQLFFTEFEREHNITEDYTEEQKEQCKREFLAYILSYPVSEGNEDEFIVEANNMIGESLEWKGVKQRKKTSRRKHKRTRTKRHRTSKRN